MAENHTHYRDYRDVRGDGRIVLYRRADNQGLNWSVRLKIPTAVGYVVKSARTADDFEEWKKSLGLDRKIRSEKYTEDNIRKMEIWALPHLGNQPVEAIKGDAL